VVWEAAAATFGAALDATEHHTRDVVGG
jgi:hypothetical protein